MKLIPITYYGFTSMDRRFSSPMLPWIVSEIKKRDYSEKVKKIIANNKKLDLVHLKTGHIRY